MAYTREQITRLAAAFPVMVRDYHGVRHRLDREQVDIATTALVQFLALCVETGRPQVASEPADALWHDFILHTPAYREYCEAQLGGVVDHYPELAEPPSGYLDTRTAASERYGPLDERGWPIEERQFWSIGRFRANS